MPSISLFRRGKDPLQTWSSRPSCGAIALLGLLLLVPDTARAWPDLAPAFRAGEVELGLSANWVYDSNSFHRDPDGRFEDATGFRRRETGVFLRRPGHYEVMVQYDLEGRAWTDTLVRLHSKGLLGRDLGSVRIGYFKTPVGFDAVSPVRAAPFLEQALPVQAVYAGRRTGVEWALQRPGYLVGVSGFAGHDLEGDNHGQTVAGRAAWVPRNAPGDVLHLGVAASRERPDADTLRLRARPEAGLTPVRLVDTGTLAGVETVHRGGIEALWIAGPWSLQGELLGIDVRREGQDVRGRGGYVFGSWMLTGGSRTYGGHAGNPTAGDGDQVELLLRYSHLDLDDGAVAGGTQSDWTLGMNWYLGRNLKLQANYVHARSRRGGETADPAVLGLRAQFYF
ncbi:OprO/OprP family phosphate-selective porin [Coralloluteibacterium thermophilus]|uniref:OprO/OprP family phosphate-selective porin n=1 Tax=Coralloluteibacterium thermophilum TaxID=2707049 RepID=A0ABV9NH82_9GAMM